MHQPRSTIDRFRTNALICAGERLQTAVNRPEAIQHKDSWFTKVVFVGHRDSTDRIRCQTVLGEKSATVAVLLPSSLVSQSLSVICFKNQISYGIER